MFPHYPAIFIFTPVRSVTLGLPWRSLWLQIWVHLWCSPGRIMPTPLCMECQHLTRTNYSVPNILLLVWFLPSLCHLSASERLSYLHWLPVHYRILACTVVQAVVQPVVKANSQSNGNGQTSTPRGSKTPQRFR